MLETTAGDPCGRSAISPRGTLNRYLMAADAPPMSIMTGEMGDGVHAPDTARAKATFARCASGLRASRQSIQGRDAAAGAGDPVMILMMENAALNAISGYLEAGRERGRHRHRR